MRSASLAAALLLAAQAVAPAADPATAWKGAKVMPKLGVIAKVGNVRVDEKMFGFPWTVQAVNGRWLWVGHRRKGWVDCSQVMRLDEAIAYYTQVIKNDPQNAWAYYYRAVVCAWSGNHDSAIADFERYVWLQADAFAFAGRGITWAAKKDYDKAIDDFSVAILLDPGFAPAYWLRGHVWNERKDFAKAIADFDQAIRLDPHCAQAHLGRAASWVGIGEFGKAIDDYNQAIRFDPSDPHIFDRAAGFRAGSVDDRYRDGEKAVALATRACELTDWKNSEMLDTLAAAHDEAGNHESAIRYQKRAIELNPSDAEFVKGAKERLAIYKRPHST